MSISHNVEQATELLAFLFAWRSEVKRTKVRQWLKRGLVEVNGQAVTRFNYALQAGDTVSICNRNEVQTERRLPVGMKLLFEDASLIVIEKPANLLSMATEREQDKTAYAYLTNHVRLGDPWSSERVWIVHRLDRETSGLMVFAKTEAAKRILQAHWAKTEKRYLAIVEGHPSADDGVLESHLDESNPYKVYSAPAGKRTRHAVTRYRLIKRTENLALLELTPETGRRNQIRVHLADAGCPVIGDQKYGTRTNLIRRLGLHANFLQFTHPLSGERLTFESPLPRNLTRLL